MLRRVQWVAILAGIAATLSLLYLILAFGSSFFLNPMPAGMLLEGPAWYLRVLVSVLVPLSCLLFACFLGGLTAGGLAATSPGLNGGVSVTLGTAGGFLWFSWGLLPWIFVVPSNPGEVFTRSDNVGALIVITLVFCAVFPFVALAGFLGGRLGGRLRPATRP